MYEYNKVKFHFFYDVDAKTHLQTEIWIRGYFHYTDNRSKEPKEFKHCYSSEQIEKYFVPIISIKKGYDPITSSLLYLNDEYCKGFFKRIISEGTDWFEFSGIKVFPDGTWRIET